MLAKMWTKRNSLLYTISGNETLYWYYGSQNGYSEKKKRDAYVYIFYTLYTYIFYKNSVIYM